MNDIYSEWDSGNLELRSFKTFGAGWLKRNSSLSEEQARMLVELIDDFVSAATERQRAYMKGPFDSGVAEVARDIDRLPDDVYASVEEALALDTETFAGMSRGDVEVAVRGRNSLWRRMKELVLGGVENGGLYADMKPFVERAEDMETLEFFRPKEGNVSGVPSARDFTLEHRHFGTLRRANAAKSFLNALESDSSDTDWKAGAECLCKGLSSGLLSDEEGVLKRLSALAFLAAWLGEHLDDMAFAPFAALGAAKAAYDFVGTQKSIFLTARIGQLCEGVERLGVDDEGQTGEMS